MARSAVCGAAFIVVLLCMLMTSPYVINAKVTCGQVVTLLTPCIPFGVFGGTVPPECCAGIKGSMMQKRPQRIAELHAVAFNRGLQ